MHKSKKKSSKTAKLPKPIKVKKEKTEEDRTLHAMSHYVDDRLELIKQIFGTLKPKTITNLAPDFLKKKNMVDIEELCLNELLCISTKRLMSIINASKCPTDTESSDDSDIQHQEEHISLEEISSDSEIDESASGTKKLNGNSNKQKAKKDTKKPAENSNEADGQISVLELLELQARARAIRSQLALEPVTKIEVDSGDEGGKDKEKSKDKEKEKEKKVKNGNASSEHQSHKRKLADNERADKVKTSRTVERPTPPSKPAQLPKETTTSSKEQPAPAASQPTKKIKLKRNYRNANQEPTSPDANASAANKRGDSVLKREHRSRSPSPDVIPIVNEPETLLISDSETEETQKDAKKHTDSTKTDKIANAPKAVDEETEEGEITDSETDKVDKQETQEQANTVNSNVESGNTDESKADQNSSESHTEVVQSNDEVTERGENAPNAAADTTAKLPAENTESNAIQTQDASNVLTDFQDDGDNDDVISIGGDLESEMIEHLEDDTNSKSSYATNTQDDAKKRNDDVISLGSSAEEDEVEKKNSESWHARYIKSSKVSKVLAASRLGSKMRDNIKKTKRSKKEEAATSLLLSSPKPKESFTSQHEDGSVDQYKELLGLRKN